MRLPISVQCLPNRVRIAIWIDPDLHWRLQEIDDSLTLNQTIGGGFPLHYLVPIVSISGDTSGDTFRSNQTTIGNPIITYLVPTVPTTFLILFFLPL